MPEIASREFARIFQNAISKSGRLSQNDVNALQSARARIRNTTEKAAADGLLSMLKHDREFDAFEVAPAKKALGVLVGVSTGRLPADLEQVLTHAVPAANVKVQQYDLTFDFSKDAPDFPAHAVITLETKAGKDAILEVDPERLTIQSVKAGGKDVPFTLKDGRLHVTAPGATALDVQYRVKPQDVHGNADTAYGLIRDKYAGRMWSLTWPYNTGALFPSNSHPSDGATTKVTLTVAAGDVGLASGNRQGATSTFVSGAQAPAYAVAVYDSKQYTVDHVGKSKDGVQVDGLGLGNAISRPIRDAYRKEAIGALDYFTQWLGQYDYGNSLSLVELAGGLGGMEHTSAVAIMLGNASDKDTARETAVHETAHHWFGDNIRIGSWGDFWMSEGFTNYATYRYFRNAEGEAKYGKLLDGAKDEVRSALQDNPHALAAPANTDVNEIFDSIPYEMGPWVLRMLEVKLGTPTFDSLLKEWFHEMRQKSVTTDDFVKFAKAKTGQDFGTFFKEWNSLTAVPTFDGAVKPSGTKASVTLSKPAGIPSGIEVPLRLEGEGGKSKTVLVKPGDKLEVDAGFPVKKFSWDPERTVLADVR
jgi:aminopeptidase N